MLRPLPKAWSARQWMILIALLAAGVWSCREDLLDVLLIGIGREEQSHVLLAPFVAIWLVWLRRSRLRSLRVGPSLGGPVLILIGWGARWYGAECPTNNTAKVTALCDLMQDLVD